MKLQLWSLLVTSFAINLKILYIQRSFSSFCSSLSSQATCSSRWLLTRYAEEFDQIFGTLFQLSSSGLSTLQQEISGTLWSYISLSMQYLASFSIECSSVVTASKNFGRRALKGSKILVNILSLPLTILIHGLLDSLLIFSWQDSTFTLLIISSPQLIFKLIPKFLQSLKESVSEKE